jgi:hypothetical protein
MFARVITCLPCLRLPFLRQAGAGKGVARWKSRKAGRRVLRYFSLPPDACGHEMNTARRDRLRS